MRHLSDIGRPLQEHEVVALEAKIGKSLPAAYRQFLISNNGGVPTPNVIDIKNLPGSPTDVQVFFGIDREIQSSNLDWNAEVFSALIQDKQLLPIACDSGGDLFCVAFGETDKDSIYFCQRDGDSMKSYFVAPNTNSFINSLRSY